MEPLPGDCPAATRSTPLYLCLSQTLPGPSDQEGLSFVVPAHPTGLPFQVPLNALSFTAGISAAQRMHDLPAALELFEEMHATEVAPNPTIVGTAVSARAHSWRWQQAVQLLSQLGRGGSARRSAAYNEVLAACVREQEWERATTVYRQMEEAAVPQDPSTLGLAAHVFSASGDWERGCARAVTWPLIASPRNRNVAAAK